MRRSAVLAAAVLLAGLAGCSSDQSPSVPAPDSSVAAPASTPSTASVATPPTRATAPTALGSPALALLARVPIKGRAPKTGYDRAQYGQAWTDNNDDLSGHNGCDTRNDVLRRDLLGTTVKPGTHGCVVLTGVLHDPYTGATIDFTRGVRTSLAVQIDHVVALGDSWQTGAQQFSAAKRVDFANDPLNLLAVAGPANEAKSDGDAASWLPPNKTYRCAYVARQTAVKVRYGLWMTQAEHDATARVLSSCPGQKAPIVGGRPPAVHPVADPVVTRPSPNPAPTTARAPLPRRDPTASPASTPTPASPASTAPPASGAHEFANCADMHKTYPHGVGKPGARDHTSGTPDTQFVVSTALYDANSKSDRDKDGIACEA